jgi:multiple sugar transport system substrate-binding protein
MIIRLASLFLFLFLLQACSNNGDGSHYVQAELDIWLHYGSENERRTFQEQVARFNDMQDQVVINAVILPAGNYHEQVSAAARNHRLPDILEIDPAYIGYRASLKQLQPIDKLLSDSVRGDLLLPLVQENIYRGRLYAVSPESRVALIFVRRSALQAANIPAAGLETWTLDRFYQVIRRLGDNGRATGYVELRHIDDEQNLSDEILPLVYASEASAGNGAVFVDRLNTRATLDLFRFFQEAFQQGTITRHDEDAVVSGRTKLALGTQADIAIYRQAWKDDLLILPLPGVTRSKFMFHNSWSLGITRDCRDPRLAVRFIEFLLEPEEVLTMAEASATIPATGRALDMFESFPLAKALPQRRPPVAGLGQMYTTTPAYPHLRARFYALFRDVITDTDVTSAVEQARADMNVILRQYQSTLPATMKSRSPAGAVKEQPETVEKNLNGR